MKKITLLLTLWSCIMYSQEYIYIDFGSGSATYPTSGNWNNFSNPAESPTLEGLINSNGALTGINFRINDAFDRVNFDDANNPTASSPISSTAFPVTATKDSFFGEGEAFEGTTEATGGFLLTGLDNTKYYSFSIFGSRSGVSDNRETQYTVTGASSQSVTLNTSNNSANTVEVYDIQPTASGEITFVAQPGPNNDNTYKFYYLGAVEISKTDQPLTTNSFKLSAQLKVYPTTVHDYCTIDINLKSAVNLDLDLYDLNGRLVSKLFRGKAPAGAFSYQWRASAHKAVLNAGLYFLKVTAGNESQTTKLIIK